MIEIEKILDKAFEIGCDQDKQEIFEFIEILQQHKIKNILEIGTHKGGTFYIWTQIVDKNGKKISVDIPLLHPKNKNFVDFNIRNKYLINFSDNIFIVEGDSHKDSTLEKVKEVLKVEKLDLLFIDGDHSQNGVTLDYIMYQELVGSGGIIAFHDIKNTRSHRRAGCFVSKFWETITIEKHEILNNTVNWAGIGYIIKK